MAGSPQEKMVRKKIAIELGLVCIILIASLGAAIGYYTINIGNKEGTIANLNDLVNLANYDVIADNQTFTQATGNYTSWTFTANFTGYLFFWVRSGNPIKSMYVEVVYNATVPVLFYVGATRYYRGGGYTSYHYNEQINLTENPYPVFPILPSFLIYQNNLRTGTSVNVRLVNTSTLENATEQVTMIYYY